PNHEPAVSRLRNALRHESVPVTIREITVRDETMAQALRFPGSPTIRVNGIDAEASEPHSVGLACRLYSNGSGVPSEEMLRRAIANARLAEGKA
ncbi:MAG: DF family (seleno)protein, partial [Candidatus Angelobacter sp.]